MKNKSKKPLTTSQRLELLESLTPLFLDRNQGNKRMPSLLREAGVNVRWHSAEGFPSHETNDVDWIRAVASKGYVIITSDKSIETDPLEREAVIESKAKVFVLDEGCQKPIHWASAIIVSRDRIYEVVKDHAGPFFVSVARKTPSMVYRLRFPLGEPETPATGSVEEKSAV